MVETNRLRKYLVDAEQHDNLRGSWKPMRNFLRAHNLELLDVGVYTYVVGSQSTAGAGLRLMLQDIKSFHELLIFIGSLEALRKTQADHFTELIVEAHHLFERRCLSES